MKHWKDPIKLTLFLAALALIASRSTAQELEDSLDAELDAVATQEANEVSPPAKSGVDADEIQLDDDEGMGKPDNVVEEPKKSMKNSDEIEKEFSEEPAPAKEELQSSDSIDDEQLDLDDEKPAEKVAAPKEASPEAPVVKQETTPQDSGDDLSLDSEQKPEVAAQPELKAEPAKSLFDEPNLEFEKRLNRIVKSYDVFSQKDWDELIGSKTPEVYAVQPGDTLWDISKTFFGDGFFWAKLWSQNGVIDNPHKISKGKGIKFIEGTEADAPSIGITEKVVASNSNVISVNPMNETVNQAPTYREEVEDDITPEEMESGVVLEQDELIPAPELPPPSKRAPLLKNLPTSFRETVPASDIGYDASGFKAPPQRKATEPAVITLSSYATDRRPDSLGSVDEMEFGDQVASLGQTLIVNLNAPIDIGKTITFADIRERMSGAPGPTIVVGGLGRVIQVVSTKKNAYRVLVTKSLGPIYVGSMVLSDPPPTVTVSREGHRSEAEVSVIGGEFDQNRKILGAGSIIYLNGGASAGLKAGDILGIQSRSEDRKASHYANAARPIGLVRVADVRNKVATAIVIESQEEILVGDRTGGELPKPKPAIDF